MKYHTDLIPLNLISVDQSTASGPYQPHFSDPSLSSLGHARAEPNRELWETLARVMFSALRRKPEVRFIVMKNIKGPSSHQKVFSIHKSTTWTDYKPTLEVNYQEFTMVKVAIAGGTGKLGQTIAEVLSLSSKQSVIILSRQVRTLISIFSKIIPVQ